MSILSKAIYRFNAITIKIPRTLSQKYSKMILKIFLEPQNTQLPKLTGEKKIAVCISFPIQTIL